MIVAGVIPARGGSKGVPRKNIALLGGKPLVVHTIEAALAAKRLTRTILTTDDEEIAAVGRAAGIEVPFLRPADLAGDRSPTLPVLQHAVAWLEANGLQPDAICLLQPTNPLRGAALIDACIAEFEARGADCVFTTLPVPAEHNPHWVYESAAGGSLRLSTGEAEPIPRRQSLPPAYHREGSVYITRRDVLMRQGSLYGQRVFGYPLDAALSVNIDTEDDLRRAEAMLAARR